MKNLSRLLILIAAQLGPASALAEGGVTVFAAASLRGALDEVAAGYDGRVVVSYGGSGQIARQVAQGAPADIALLANERWMDWLEAEAQIEGDSRRNLLTNRLVLIGPADAAPLSQITVDGLLSRLAGGRLAIGQTRGVPAGIYGRQWLENAGLWEALAPQLAETENVRAALALVARAEAPLGVVYATDALAEPKVVALYDIPADLHDPVIYPMAIIRAKTDPEVIEFITHLASEDASDMFRRHGFDVPGPAP